MPSQSPVASLEGGRAHRPSPSGGASSPARSRLTRYPVPPPPPPHTHPCAPPAVVRRCSRQWEHPGISASERRSGRRQRSTSFPWQGRGRGTARGGRGVKPEPPRGGSRGRRRGRRSRGPARGSSLLSRGPCRPGLRRCICIRSSPGLSTLETTATPWAASGMSPSR